jgi:hypothetical protein
MAGTLTISTLSDGTNSTSATNCIQGSAKAWVNFNGTGTIAIRASYNVSSITDNGTGDYTVNFTNALTDANYAVTGTMSGISDGAGDNAVQGPATTTYATSSFRVFTSSNTTTKDDSIRVCLAVFR